MLNERMETDVKYIEKDGIRYALDKDFAMVVGFQENISENIIIPYKIEGLPVQGIQEFAFHGCKTIKSIVLPGSVDYIDYGAFWFCENLQKIYLPKLLRQLDDNLLAGDIMPEVFFAGTKEEFKNVFMYDIYKYGIAENTDGYRICVGVHCIDGDLIC